MKKKNYFDSISPQEIIIIFVVVPFVYVLLKIFSPTLASFWKVYIGPVVTLVGVSATIYHSNEQWEKDYKSKTRPYFYAEICTNGLNNKFKDKPIYFNQNENDSWVKSVNGIIRIINPSNNIAVNIIIIINDDYNCNSEKIFINALPSKDEIIIGSKINSDYISSIKTIFYTTSNEMGLKNLAINDNKFHWGEDEVSKIFPQYKQYLKYPNSSEDTINKDTIEDFKNIQRFKNSNEG